MKADARVLGDDFEKQRPPQQKYMKRRYQTRRLPNDVQLIPKLEKANVEFSAVSPAISTFASKGALATAFVWLPIIPLIVLAARHHVGKQSGLQNGKKKKNAQDDSKGPKTTFKDVAGVDEAKQELYELVQMLRNEERYKEVRHRPGVGCLLVGPPGTGKLLLAERSPVKPASLSSQSPPRNLWSFLSVVVPLAFANSSRKRARNPRVSFSSTNSDAIGARRRPD